MAAAFFRPKTFYFSYPKSYFVVMKISRECFIIPQAVKKPTKTRASTSSRSMQKEIGKKGGNNQKEFSFLEGKTGDGEEVGWLRRRRGVVHVAAVGWLHGGRVPPLSVCVCVCRTRPALVLTPVFSRCLGVVDTASLLSCLVQQFLSNAIRRLFVSKHIDNSTSFDLKIYPRPGEIQPVQTI
jgi:hypothetical protein